MHHGIHLPRSSCVHSKVREVSSRKAWLELVDQNEISCYKVGNFHFILKYHTSCGWNGNTSLHSLSGVVFGVCWWHSKVLAAAELCLGGLKASSSPRFPLGMGWAWARSWEVTLRQIDQKDIACHTSIIPSANWREVSFGEAATAGAWLSISLLVAGGEWLHLHHSYGVFFWSSVLHLLVCPYLGLWTWFSLPVLFLPHWAGSVWMAVGV